LEAKKKLTIAQNYTLPVSARLGWGSLGTIINLGSRLGKAMALA